jgi:hypothetical protein
MYLLFPWILGILVVKELAALVRVIRQSVKCLGMGITDSTALAAANA